MRMGDTETEEFRRHGNDQEGLRQAESDLENEDELRVPRTEEELRVGTREREAGAGNMRKRVRTNREHLEVPTRREEVTVDRVPVEADAAKAEDAWQRDTAFPLRKRGRCGEATSSHGRDKDSQGRRWAPAAEG